MHSSSPHGAKERSSPSDSIISITILGETDPVDTNAYLRPALPCNVIRHDEVIRLGFESEIVHFKPLQASTVGSTEALLELSFITFTICQPNNRYASVDIDLLVVTDWDVPLELGKPFGSWPELPDVAATFTEDVRPGQYLQNLSSRCAQC